MISRRFGQDMRILWVFMIWRNTTKTGTTILKNDLKEKARAKGSFFAL